jgi:hypothetical protein
MPTARSDQRKNDSVARLSMSVTFRSATVRSSHYVLIPEHVESFTA